MEQLYLMHTYKEKKTAKMRRQKNKSQMKEQEKSQEKELNEIEASKLPDTEFKTIVKRMLKELSETFNNMKNYMRTTKKN